MTDTKELLQKIAALRLRLNSSSEPTTPAPDPVRAVAEKVQRGTVHNTLIESSLRAAQASEPAAVAPSLRMTSRGMRLLKKGREILQALRKITDDSAYQEASDADVLGAWHHDATALIEVVLRTAQAFPSSVSAQLRLCDGLDVVIAEAEERLVRLTNKLGQRRQTATQIDVLADLLRSLALKKPIGLAALQAIADGILADATSNAPLRFLSASPNDPARFAAAHSLNVAQVLARLIVGDAQWLPQQQLAVIAALVHDVGMTRVPPEVLLSQGPLAPEQRRLIEKHTTI
ncbi:MAG TPA: hypothetical protein VFE62_23890, partial [Gemmataceae bacterium]|nr:hypothetical protein [Gemmataceae bacterium]